jgi:hypothetical protein
MTEEGKRAISAGVTRWIAEHPEEMIRNRIKGGITRRKTAKTPEERRLFDRDRQRAWRAANPRSV